MTNENTNTNTMENPNGNMIVFQDENTLMEVSRIPVCRFCRELDEDCIGFDEKTQTCEPCRKENNL